MKELKTQNLNLIYTSHLLIVAFLVIFLRYYVLTLFAFQYPDSDQAIMWNAAVDFSKGIFHEPRYFGQNYNSMLESLLAVPLLFCSVPVYKALPTITSILALFPFFLVSIICFFKNLKPQAIIVICMPLLLPIEYDFITSLSRGFVTGIFAASIGCIAIYFPNKKWGYICFAFFAMLGYSLNPNSFLLSLPCAVYLFLENYKRISFYIFSAIGFIPAALIDFWANHFYVTHPNYNLRPVPKFDFSFDVLFKGLSDFDEHLNFVSPVFWNSGWLLFVLLLVLAILFWRLKNRTISVSLLIVVIVFFASFGFYKTYDGSDSIFYPYSRMFLAVPLVFVFYLPLISMKRYWLSILFFATAIICFAIKTQNLPTAILKNTTNIKTFMVAVDKTERVLQECYTINYYSKKYNIEQIIIYSHGFYDFIDFGCSTCLSSFPKTLRPIYERRTWRLIEDRDKVYSKILIIDNLQAMADQLPKLKAKGIRYLNIKGYYKGYYIITDNTLTTKDLFKYLNIQVRDF